MRRLWTGEPVAFAGKHVKFPAAVCRPQPVQRPHPPVIIGGMGPNVVKRVAAWGDGWMPIGMPPDGVAQSRKEIDRLAKEQGRDAGHISITVMTGAPPGMEEPMPDLMPARAVLDAYRDAGTDRVVIAVPTLGRTDALRHLDRIAASI
jgi:hypothetical protein